MDLNLLIEKLNFSNLMWQILTPLIFSLADIITGYAQAWINNNVDSQKMRIGLLHKALIFLVIILAFIIQVAFSIKYISSTVCVYVVIMEIISILENLQKAGVDLGKLGNILKDKTQNDITNVNLIVKDIKKEKEDKK